MPTPTDDGPVFDSGISGYQPQWHRGLAQVAATHGTRLAHLTGRTLTHTWLVWDNDADRWFPDAPVLLDFDGEQLEISHHNLDAVSVTWNTINPAIPVLWPGTDLNLRWHDDPRAGLRGQRLDTVELLEWTGADVACGTVALTFTFTAQQVTIYNALDENGLSYTPPDSRYRRLRLFTTSSAAHNAVELEDLPLLRDLLDAGADVEDDDGTGWTLLLHALDTEHDGHVQTGEPLHADTTAFLLARGADPLRKRNDITALAEAQRCGHWLAAEIMQAWVGRHQAG